jgi:lipoprotein NlpI
MKKSVKFWILLFALNLLYLQIKASNEDEAYRIMQQAVRKHKSHHIPEALVDYERALALQPDWPEIYYSRGLALNEIGEYTAAIEDFNRALALDPEQDSAYFNRGISKYELRQYRSALADFNKTIEMIPGDAKAHLNRAMAKYALGDLQGALNDANKAKQFYKALNKRNEYLEVIDFINSIKNPVYEY